MIQATNVQAYDTAKSLILSEPQYPGDECGDTRHGTSRRLCSEPTLAEPKGAHAEDANQQSWDQDCAPAILAEQDPTKKADARVS